MESEQFKKQVDNNFKYHDVSASTITNMDVIRTDAKSLASNMLSVMPEQSKREMALVLTKLEEALMHFNAGMSRVEGGM